MITVDTKIVYALQSIAPVWNSVKESEPVGDEEREQQKTDIYFVFNYSTLGAGYADNDPTGELYLIQVHLFAPLATNLTRIKWRTKAALHLAGFAWPETIDASDATGRHIVFEFQHVEGLDLNGDLLV